MGAKEGIMCLSHKQNLFDENWVRRYTARELKGSVLTDSFDYYSIVEAWKVKKMINPQNDELTNRHLYCDKCHHGGQLIVIGNEDYVHCLQNMLDWYPSQFIAVFMTICQHDAHVSTPPFKTNNRVMIVLTTYPGNKEQIKMSLIMET
jgi:hypothetical protein